MLFLARKNLFQEKTRLFMSVGGVTFSVMLITIMIGLYQGWSVKMGEYIRTVPADLWVEQSGADDMFHSISILPASAKNTIEQVTGVSEARPFSGSRAVFKVHEKEVILYLVGYDDKTGAGPVKMAEGSPRPRQGEIVLDKKVARDSGVKLNDTVKIADTQFKVVGISDGGNVVIFSYAFIDAAQAQSLSKLAGVVNYYIVKTKSSTDKTAVAAAIEKAVPGSKVVTKDTFAADNTKIVTDTFLPIISVLVLIGAAVGTSFIGLTTFTSAIEKAREYGVLKAIGMTNRQLYGIVIKQSLISGVIGFVFGVGLSLVVFKVAINVVPEFISYVKLLDIVWIGLLSLFMSVVAALLPVRRLAKIDPAEVFRS